jgi:hypothetical protein
LLSEEQPPAILEVKRDEGFDPVRCLVIHPAGDKIADSARAKS